MDFEKLINESKQVIISDKYQDVIAEIAIETKDPLEAAILGFSYGMLSMKYFVGEAFEDE